MRKFFFVLMALISMFAIQSNAQKAYETPKFLDNTMVGIGLGASAPLTFDNVFPVNPSVNVFIQKDWSPVLGTRVEGSFFTGDNLGFNHNVCISKTLFRASNVSLLGTLNWSNLLNGYKGKPRTVELSTIAGLGWGHVFNNGGNTHRDDLTAKTGVEIGFNLGKTKAWGLAVQPSVIWNLTGKDNNKIQFDKRMAQLSLVGSLSYRFKTSNGTHNFKVYDITAYELEIARLKGEIEGLRSKAPVVLEKETFVPQPLETQKVISFAQNSAVLSSTAMAILNEIPEGSVVSIIATTSPEGTADRNTKLARERAQSVADYLIHRGVDVRDAQSGDAGRLALIQIMN